MRKSAARKKAIELVEASRPHFVYDNFVASGDCTQVEWDRFWLERSVIGPCITAVLQLDSANRDCQIARTLFRTGKHIADSDRLSSKFRFFWQSFQHHVYIYTEKIGLLQSCCEELIAIIDRGRANPVVNLRKEASKAFKEINKVRGQVVHEWARDHNRIRFLAMVEVATMGDGPRTLPDGFYDVEGHAHDVAWDVRDEMRSWEKTLTGYNDRLLTVTVDFLVPYLKQFNDRYFLTIVPQSQAAERQRGKTVENGQP